MILSWNFLTKCWNFFGGVVKTALLTSMGKYFQLFEKLCFSYRIRTFDRKKAGFMSEKFHRCCQNCFPCFTETFRRKVLSRKKLWVFSTVSENQQILWVFARKPDGAVKTAFCLSIGPFWGKRFLRKNFGLFIIFGLRANFSNLLSTFFKGFQSCILCFHQNVSKKKHHFLKNL